MKKGRKEVFVSYAAEDAVVAQEIREWIESATKRTCWIDTEGIRTGEQFNTVIMEAIKDCDIVAFILSKHSISKTYPLLELVTAFTNNKFIFPIKVDDVDITQQHVINLFNYSIYNYNDPNDPEHNKLAHDIKNPAEYRLIRNVSYLESIEAEQARLGRQQELLKRFDSDIYDLILDKGEDLAVLDIGCNEGRMTYDRFGHRKEVSAIVAVDNCKTYIDTANGIPERAQRIKFCHADCVDDADFNQKMLDALHSLKPDKEKYDIVHISMLLLHLDNPQELLNRVIELLKPGGKIFIRDIDDTLTFYMPDPDGLFEHVVRICDAEEYSGNRHCGNMVYSYLVNAGFVNAKLHKKGLDTSGMNTEDRMTLLKTYLSFIVEDLDMLRTKTTDKRKRRQYEVDSHWMRNNIVKIYKEVEDNQVLYQLGYVTYTAEAPKE